MVRLFNIFSAKGNFTGSVKTKLLETVAIGAIFCFVAVAATYLAFNVSGAPANDVAGNVTINNSMHGDATAPVAEYGTICGMTTDMYKEGLGGVTVTCWEISIDSSGNYANVRLAAVTNNSQVSNAEPENNAVGFYMFDHVAPGTYNVTGEKDGHIAYGYVNVSRGTTTWNIAMAGLVSDESVHKSQAAANNSQATLVPDDITPTIIPPADGSPWCTIAGIAQDKVGHGLPGAKVTLMACHADASGGFVNDGKADVRDNPQYSNSNESAAMIGTYTYYGVPFGWYNVTIEKFDAAGNPHRWFKVVNATSGGTHMVNVALPDLIISAQ